jgi:N-acetylmuramoyl-L-alanine amidase CwlA
MIINKKLISYNITNAPNRPIKYIVIHTTGNQDKGANAEMHYQYFNGGDRQSSADFFIDDGQVLQVNNYKDNYTWHCGDGAGKYGITNRNSVGLEMCVNKDGDFLKVLKTTIELVYTLMKELGIPYENVVRHYDASRKNCPAELNYQNWAGWTKFKDDLAIFIQSKVVYNQVEDKVVTMADLRKELNIPDASWAASEVQKALDNGLINSKHDPNEVLTFGVMITLINNLYNKLK